MSVERYTIYYNEREMDIYVAESQDGKYCLHSDYAAIEEERDKLTREVMRLVNINEQLHERHNALRDAVHKAMDRTADCDKKQTDDQLIADVAYLKRLASDHFKTSIDRENRAFSAEQKYDALREVVAWERETDECGEWLHLAWWDEPKIDLLDIWDIHNAARAEVDRLLEEK